MLRKLLLCIPLLLLAGSASSEEPPKQGAKVLAGTAIVGNDDAPKSLVIVPWKSSDLGRPLDVSRGLDDGRRPVDRDVFLRELDYYQIRAGSANGPGSAAQ